MEPQHLSRRSTSAAALGIVSALLGSTFVLRGAEVFLKWEVISGGYALCGLTWLFAGALMIVAGLWAALSRGRSVRPLLVASGATAAAGATVLFGAVTYIVPCATPS